MPVDISEDLHREVKPEDLALIINKAREMMKLELEMEQLQELLKQKKEKHDELAAVTLPEMMKSAGCPSSLPMPQGYTLELSDVFRANIPAESTIEKANDDERPLLEQRRAEGLDWLKDNKGGDIIKTEIKLQLGKGEAKLAKAILAALGKVRLMVKGKPVKPSFTIQEKEAVHASTLSKFLREKIEKGVDVPYETFAIFKGTEALIVAPKKKKEKVTN